MPLLDVFQPVVERLAAGLIPGESPGSFLIGKRFLF
jgi:hypothetical protein